MVPSYLAGRRCRWRGHRPSSTTAGAGSPTPARPSHGRPGRTTGPPGFRRPSGPVRDGSLTLSPCVSASLSLFLSASLRLCLCVSASLPLCLSASLPLCLYLSLSVAPSNCLSTFPCLCLCLCLFPLCLSAYLTLCLILLLEDTRQFKRAEYNPPWAYAPELNRPQKSVDAPVREAALSPPSRYSCYHASAPAPTALLAHRRCLQWASSGMVKYVDGGGAEVGNNGVLLTSHADDRSFLCDRHARPLALAGRSRRACLRERGYHSARCGREVP